MRRVNFDAMETANTLINDWLQATRGLPITLQLTKLGFAVIEGLERAYELGRKDGWEAKQSEISKAVDEIIADEDGEHGEVGPDDSGIQFDGPDDEIPF